MAKPNSTRMIELRAKAKREGWARYIRQGSGEEADERAILNGCWFEPHRADHWLEFADRFGTLTEGPWAGKPFRLLPWQVDDTSRLFGWVRHSKEWGYPVRRFRMWYEEVPKKNGKTPLLSLLGNYLLFGDSVGPDGKPRQINLYLAATTRKQAERCLTHAIRQIRNNEDLDKLAKIRKLEGFHQVQYLDNEWHVVAADPESADGVNGHCLADEFHRWKGFEFYNALKWMLASQPEGVFAAITTAGEEGENVCKYTHDHALAVNAGRTIDETFVGTIYGPDRDDDPHDEATWHKCNPSLGSDPSSPIKLSTFRQDYEAAKADPTQWPSFMRLRLGYWIASTNSWIDTASPHGIADWDAGPTERANAKDRIDCFEQFDDDQLANIANDAKNITLAFDLASVRDTVAASLTIEDHESICWNRTWFWLPEAEAIRQQKRISYRRWAEDGWITLQPGDVIDYRKLLNDLVMICSRFNVTRFYYDPQFQAEWLTQELELATGAERVQFPQTIMHYGPVVKDCERRIISHTLRHNGNPVLTWQMINAVARTNANGDKRLVKQNKGEFKKVDGAQALVMSLHDSLAAQNDDRSYYDNNEFEVI
jgi:phage terminase large subunit-like protein